MEIFKLFGSIFVDTNEANKSISKTDEKAETLGTKLGNGVKKAGEYIIAIAGVATAIGGAVVGAGAKALESYADYEQLVGGVETLFGDSADKVIDYANKAYETAGMNANTYMENVTGISASLLQSLEGDTAKAAEAANQAMIDMSDNANKMGTDISSIQNTYQGFAKQNYTMLDNLKLGYGGTKAEMERLLADAEKISGVEYDLSNLNDVYSAIHVIQTEMGITGTTQKEAATTISGSINMIKQRLSNFKNEIGEKIAPTVQKFLNLAIDNLPMVEKLVEQLAPVITDLFAMLLPPMMDIVQSVLPLLMQLITTLIPPVTQILQAILPIIIQLLEMLLPPIIQIVQVLLPPLLEMLMPLLNLLAPIIELLNPILSLVTSLLAPIAELITKFLTPLIDIISKIIEVCLVPLQRQLTHFSGFLSGTFKAVMDWFLNEIDMIKGVFSGLIEFFTGVFTGDWEKAWDGIKNIFSSIWDGIKEAFKIPINWIIDGINAFIEGINAMEIPDWVPVVGGKSLDISLIPRLAKGGILEKGQLGFLEGTGAEAVVPLENNRKWISAVAEDMSDVGIGGGKTVTLLAEILRKLETLANMGIYLDTDKLVGELAKPLDRKLGEISTRKVRA